MGIFFRRTYGSALESKSVKLPDLSDTNPNNGWGKNIRTAAFLPSNRAILLTGNGCLLTHMDAKGIATSVTQLPGVWISPSNFPHSGGGLSEEILVLDGASLLPLERIATKEFGSLASSRDGRYIYTRKLTAGSIMVIDAAPPHAVS